MIHIYWVLSSISEENFTYTYALLLCAEVRKPAPAHNNKACGGVQIELISFLTSALNEGEWSASCPDRFALGKG